MATQKKIIDKALGLFNTKGIEYVGMREVAAALDMRIGNITYYFPTKDDLVMAIAHQLYELNSGTIGADSSHSLKDFLLMYRQTFYNQYKYRCLFLSFVHLVSQNASMAKEYKETNARRKQNLENHIDSLVKNGYLVPSAGKKAELIVSHFSLIIRFWISEARISYSNWKLENTVAHYLGLLYDVLYPYTTLRGKKNVSDLKFLFAALRK